MRKIFMFVLLAICCYSTTFAYESKIKFSERIYSTINFSYTDIYKDSRVLHLDSKTPTGTVITGDALWFRLENNTFWLLPDEDIDLFGDSLVVHNTPYNAQKRNNDLYFFTVLKRKTGKTFGSLFEPAVINKKITKMARSVRDQRDSILAYIDAYSIEKPLSDTFKSFCRQYIDAEYAHELLNMVTINKHKVTDLEKNDQALMDECLGYNIMVPTVEDYVEHYIFLQRKGKDSTYFATEKETLAAKFSQQTLERIAFLAVKNSMLKNSVYTGSYQQTDIANNTYRIYLDKLSKFKDDDSKEKTLLTMDGKRIQLMKTLKDSAKIHYLCFWNTASPSSVQEIKKWMALANTHKDSHVRIMLISLDENPVTWNVFCKENGMDKFANNYMLPRNYTSVIAESYKVTTVPRCVVLDAQGYVISLNAPLPSTDNIKFLEARYAKYYAK